MKEKMKSLSILGVLVATFSIPSLNSVVYAQDEANFRAPVEKTINGVLYLDGIPVLPDNYKQLKDEELSEEPEFIESDVVTHSLKALRGVNAWFKVSEANSYSGHDYDRYNNHTSKSVKISLKTISSMTASISGSIEYGLGTNAIQLLV
ncbi:hypothetical protein SAMN05444162_0393 [Paenibacillaceae bacterium GAS479]|nr:hypothetical protein SAMN05444162_0393 [Paenibacillaceae bacterium GAS479]